MALRRRRASRGLTSQPSAWERRARKTSARRSSSMSTGTWGRRPAPSSSRRSRQAAMPPMFPICRSMTARAGVCSRTAGSTSAPRVTSRTASSLLDRVAVTSSITQRASLATRTSAIAGSVAKARGRVPYAVAAPNHGCDAQEVSVLQIELEEADGYTICRPVGELDAYTVGQFRESLGELASRPKLLIDMSAVPFVDSAGLGALIGGIRRARESGGDVAVCCNRPTLVRLLHTTGFDRIVTVTETVEEAAAFLGDDNNEVAPA